MILEPISKWLLPFKLPLFLNGSHSSLKEVDIIQSQSCQVKFDKPVYIHADGEVIKSEETDFQIEVKPGKLSVISGPDQ